MITPHDGPIARDIQEAMAAQRAEEIRLAVNEAYEEAAQIIESIVLKECGDYVLESLGNKDITNCIVAVGLSARRFTKAIRSLKVTP